MSSMNTPAKPHHRGQPQDRRGRCRGPCSIAWSPSAAPPRASCDQQPGPGQLQRVGTGDPAPHDREPNAGQYRAAWSAGARPRPSWCAPWLAAMTAQRDESRTRAVVHALTPTSGVWQPTLMGPRRWRSVPTHISSTGSTHSGGRSVPPPFPIPADVRAFVHASFARCNARISSRLTRLPTLHETYLDMCFIDTLSDVAAPHITPTGYIVDIDVHFLGQGRHWASWEVADLGVIVNYRQHGRLLRTKVALLQSKRLYPREAEFVEDEALSKYHGFGDMLKPPSLPAQTPMTFRFDDSCRYRALQVGDDQWKAIAGYERRFAIPVHYLLYHPSELPSQQVVPVLAATRLTAPRPTVGSRVCRAAALHNGLSHLPRNYAPSYGDMIAALGPLGARGRTFGGRLEAFVSNDLLDCREGYVAASPDPVDEGVQRVFAQRDAPIAAALRIDISAPEDVEAIEAE